MDGFRMSDPNSIGATAGGFDHALMSSFFPSGMPPSLHEVQSVVHFKNTFGSRTANFPMHQGQHGIGLDIDLTDNVSDDDSTAADGEKTVNGCRKRLSVHQVHCLEKCFKVDSKLEPRRKTELARELGLKPRQVAIWFQNRRARHKNKQIEKDYDKIAAQYGMIKAQYDKVINENKKLKAQMKSMKEEMSLMKDSLLNYANLIQGGLLEAHMMQPKVSQTRAEAELQQAYNNIDEFNDVCNGGTSEHQVQVQQQQVISPASSVFESNSPVVKPQSSKMLAPLDISHPAVEPAEKISTNFMQCEQENSVNQELQYDLPNLFELDEPNCFYTSQVGGPIISPCDFGVIPDADDPFWQFEV